MLHVQDHDRQALMRRKAKPANVAPTAEELSAVPDDDKLLP
jgi:potassium-dependent mechanosensitive channel